MKCGERGEGGGKNKEEKEEKGGGKREGEGGRKWWRGRSHRLMRIESNSCYTVLFPSIIFRLIGQNVKNV